MKVILKQEVDALGTIGDVVKVKDGYARNYLVPQGLAIVANDRNLKAVEGEKRRLAKVRANNVSLAESLKSQLESVRLEFVRQAGDDGKLHGSVTNQDIADALGQKGFNIDKRKISAGHINHTGEVTISVKLFQDIAADLTVSVRATETTSEA